MIEFIRQEPLWLQAWILWMVLVNTASVVFVRRDEARWVLTCWLGNVLTMSALFAQVGYVRLLGLAHVVWWTPLVVYLWRRRGSFPGATPFGVWVRLLLATNAASLVIDYADVARYLLGDRG